MNEPNVKAKWNDETTLTHTHTIWEAIINQIFIKEKKKKSKKGNFPIMKKIIINKSRKHCTYRMKH